MDGVYIEDLRGSTYLSALAHAPSLRRLSIYNMQLEPEHFRCLQSHAKLKRLKIGKANCQPFQVAPIERHNQLHFRAPVRITDARWAATIERGGRVPSVRCARSRSRLVMVRPRPVRKVPFATHELSSCAPNCRDANAQGRVHLGAKCSKCPSGYCACSGNPRTMQPAASARARSHRCD